MEITFLDFVLFNSLSYILGIATGLTICCKHKEKFMMRSRSLETITNSQYNHHRQPSVDPNEVIIASAPLSTAPMAPAISPQKRALHLTLD